MPTSFERAFGLLQHRFPHLTLPGPFLEFIRAQEENGHILRRMSQSGPTVQSIDFSDFRPVGGMNVAFKRTISSGGQQVGSVTLVEYEINPTTDPKMFERPAK